MKVAIDARGVHSKLQGIGRHVINLLLGLSYRESDLEFLVIYSDPVARKVVERAGGPYRGRFEWVKAMAGPGNLLEHVELPWLLKIHRADLFHNVGCSAVWTAQIPVVTTVHELAALHYDPKPESEKLKRTLRNSALIISVSESVADEVENHFNISRPRIRVISNAVDPWYTERVTENEVRAMRERLGLQGNYFLCVTADKKSKNPEFVKKAAEKWTGPERWVFTLPGTDNEKFRYLGLVEDAWLRPLYGAAKALIAPSLYEGFSLPPIEALATGSLPVVSDIAAHRELLGDVLLKDLFFDPTVEDSLMRALRAAVDGGESIKSAVAEKFRLVKDRYSYVETADRVQAVYREAL